MLNFGKPYRTHLPRPTIRRRGAPGAG